MITKLIFITLFILLSILHSWWKKRQEEGEQKPDADDWPGSKPRPPRPPLRPPPVRPAPPPAQAGGWAEELRRVVQQHAPAPPPLPPASAKAAPRPAAAVPTRLPASQSRPATPPPMMGSDPDMEKGLAVKLPGLTQSAQAYLRASQLEQKVSAQMRRVEQQVAAHKVPQETRETPGEVRHAIALVRQRSSIRAAILAGVILGPPRALEPVLKL